jgi:hypothetical protein
MPGNPKGPRPDSIWGVCSTVTAEYVVRNTVRKSGGGIRGYTVAASVYSALSHGVCVMVLSSAWYIVAAQVCP